MKIRRKGKKSGWLIPIIALALVFMNIGIIFSIAEPDSSQEPVETVLEAATGQETEPATEPEATTEPLTEEPTQDTQPESPSAEPETPEPETPEPAPATAAEPEATSYIPETTPIPAATQPAAAAAADPAWTPQPQSTQSAATQAATTQQEVPSYTEEATTEAQTETTEAESTDASEPQTGVPNVVVTGAYRPVTISYASEQEIAESIRSFLEKNEKSLTQMQKNILQACIDTVPASAGYCAQWVSRVYSAVGIRISGNAADLWNAYCKSDDRKELKPGMLVAVSRSRNDPNTWGYRYGQVGIYVGDGMVADSASLDGTGVKTLNTLDDWIKGYDAAGTVRWGYPDGVVSGQDGPDVDVIDEPDGVQLLWNEDPDAFGYLVYSGDEIIANIRDSSVTTYRDDRSPEAGEPDSYAVTPYLLGHGIVRPGSPQSGDAATGQAASTATAIQVADMRQLTSVPVTVDNFLAMVSLVPSMTKEELVALGIEMYGVDSRWMQALIGTTAREGYVGDVYLYYAWACTMLNHYRGHSADALYALMDPWGGAACPNCGKYYSEHAVLYGCGSHISYSTVSEYILKCVYLAMINRDYRITEVDGMIDISSAPPSLGLIYNSPVYNCQVWTYLGG